MKPLRQYVPQHKSAGAIPARCAVGNLVWTHSGAVWGIWRVKPVPYKYLSHAAKLAFHENVRQSILALPVEAMMLSVCPPLNRVHAAMSILKGAEHRESWQAEASEAVETLTAWDPFERWFYVAGRLGSREGWWGEIREQSASVLRRPFTRPMERDIRKQFAAAAKIEADLRRSLTVTRPGASEARWLYARALRRGQRDLDPPDVERREIQAPGFEAIGDVITHEGGDSKGLHGLRQKLRPYLKVIEPSKDGQGVGYQCHLALADMPEGTFPNDYEILFALDTFDFPVDWAVKMKRVSNAETIRLLNKKARSLVNELGGDGQAREIERTGQIPAGLEDAWETFIAYRERVRTSKSEGSVSAAISLAVWGPDRLTAETRADAVAEALSPIEWGLRRPLGGQSGLLEAGMVGGRTNLVGLNYEQTCLPTDLAALAPFAGSDVGDTSGMLLGTNMDCGADRPVLWNPEAPLDAEQSGSVLFIGTSGTGKSTTMKIGAHAVVARGRRFAVVDRTPSAEWVRAARGIQADTKCSLSIISTADLLSSFDPFRIFAKMADRKTCAVGFSQLVAQVSNSDLEGISIAEAVETVADRPRASLPMMLAELQRMGDEGRKGAEEAARKVAAFARSAYGPLAFDPSLPPADLSADLVVFHVPDLSLPDRATMENEVRSRQMLTEQVSALGVFYLIAAAGRAFTLAEPTRLSVFDVDEAWAVTLSPQGNALLESTGRGGRKDRRVVWIASQHPDDISDPKLLSLCPTRFIFGQGEGAGDAAARMLGLEPSDALRTKLETDMIRWDDPEVPPQPARCLVLDFHGRVAEVLIRPPSPRLAAAFETNPKRVAAWDTALPALPANGHVVPTDLAPFEVAR